MTLAVAAGKKPAAWKGMDEVILAMTTELPELAGVRNAAPGADFRLGGSRVPRKSLRESGRTAVTANIDTPRAAPGEGPRLSPRLHHGRRIHRGARRA